MSFFNPFRTTPAKGNPAKDTPAKGAVGGSLAGESFSTRAGVPLELISYNTETEKFHLGKEALQVLRSVTGPVGVVAVCGRARQGKSFILNQLLGQSTGFVIAPTQRPCTKGLWMWSTPIERRNADGSKYNLVLLDSEGIDAYDQTGQYSTQIFSLAVLLSSLFVYNQMGGIDEAALDRLSLVTEMTKHVRVRAESGSGSTESELREFNPSFLWLLRDFYLDLEEDGRKLTPGDYLELVLKPLKGKGPSVEARNKIRDSIKNLFPSRECFALVRPMTDEHQLTKLDTISPEQLRPEFVEGMKRLTRLIFVRTQPKRLGSQLISGSMLAALAEEYVTAINGGAIPTIATAWQGVAEAECRRAADAAEAAYHAAFKKDVTGDEASMDAEHQRCMALAHKAYAVGAIGDQNIRQANEQRYNERLTSQFQQLRQQRLASSESECRKLIAEITTKLTQMSNREETSLAELQEALTSWEQQYRAAPKTEGSSKWRLHAEFIQGTYAGIARGLIQRQERAAKASQLAADEQLRRREDELRQARQRVAQLESQLEAAKQEAARKNAALEEKLRSATLSQEQNLSKTQEQHRTEIQQLKHALQQAQTASSGIESAATQRLSQVQTQLRSTEQEVQRLQNQINNNASTKEAASAQLSQKSAELAGVQSELSAVKDQLAAARDHAAQAQAAHQAAEQQIAQLQAAAAARPATPPANGPADMEDDGYGTPDEDRTAHLSPSTMTINSIKDWLTEHGHEDVVWELTTARAKKPRYVEEMNKVLGR